MPFPRFRDMSRALRHLVIGLAMLLAALVVVGVLAAVLEIRGEQLEREAQKHRDMF